MQSAAPGAKSDTFIFGPSFWDQLQERVHKADLTVDFYTLMKESTSESLDAIIATELENAILIGVMTDNLKRLFIARATCLDELKVLKARHQLLFDGLCADLVGGTYAKHDPREVACEELKRRCRELRRMEEELKQLFSLEVASVFPHIENASAIVVDQQFQIHAENFAEGGLVDRIFADLFGGTSVETTVVKGLDGLEKLFGLFR